MRLLYQLIPVVAAIFFSGAGCASDEINLKSSHQLSFMESSIDKAQSTLGYALGLVGVNYKSGGTSPETGFDCSGFVSYVYRQASNMILPHNAKAISMFGRKIAITELRPGDLVFYNTMRHTYSHVGIYLGDSKFVHSSVTGRGVEVVDMKDRYWAKRFNGARRMLTAQAISPPTSGFSPE